MAPAYHGEDESTAQAHRGQRPCTPTPHQQSPSDRRGHHRQRQRHLCQQNPVRCLRVRQRRPRRRQGHLRRDTARRQSGLRPPPPLAHRQAPSTSCCSTPAPKARSSSATAATSRSTSARSRRSPSPMAIGTTWARCLMQSTPSLQKRGGRNGSRQPRHVQRAWRAPGQRHRVPRRQGPHARRDGGPRRHRHQRRRANVCCWTAISITAAKFPASAPSRQAAPTISAAATTKRNGPPIPT